MIELEMNKDKILSRIKAGEPVYIREDGRQLGDHKGWKENLYTYGSSIGVYEKATDKLLQLISWNGRLEMTDWHLGRLKKMPDAKKIEL